MTNTIHIEWDERSAIDWALREDGMSAAALAKRIGMDASKLSRIISGEQKKLPIDELQRIADGQGRPLSYYTDEVEFVVHRLRPDFVFPLSLDLGRRQYPRYVKPNGTTVRAHETTDWDQRPIDIYADIPDAA